ncbi:MAG: hypothetical protein ACD_11C00118G0003 [uncultured bacterium]|nr:MAG: hypothetical protein ACD_11C00118G0003 [uncultured bacterium]HBR71595.1 RluA family pseudouridine synthase [Candidatus Moranbacteria bacterium]
MKQIVVTTENAGKRADKFLSEEFFSMSRGEIIRQIKKGTILINGKVIKPSYILVEGDNVEINFVFDEKKLIANPNIKIKIVFEDENILVLDKPFGTQMHPSAVEKENTVANWLVAKYPEIADVYDESVDGYLRPGIVHRLDKDTSGLVVVAKNKKSFDELKNIFAERQIEKKYVALVFGNLQNKEGIIDKPLTRATNFKKQKIATGKSRGKIRNAVTTYQVLKSYVEYDLIEAIPKTGRMHQIRAHFSSIGHPIVGDEKYFLKKYADVKIACVKRQLLHAKELKMELLGKKYHFFSEIPQDFSEALAKVD